MVGDRGIEFPLQIDHWPTVLAGIEAEVVGLGQMKRAVEIEQSQDTCNQAGQSETNVKRPIGINRPSLDQSRPESSRLLFCGLSSQTVGR